MITLQMTSFTCQTRFVLSRPLFATRRRRYDSNRRSFENRTSTRSTRTDSRYARRRRKATPMRHDLHPTSETLCALATSKFEEEANGREASNSKRPTTAHNTHVSTMESHALDTHRNAKTKPDRYHRPRQDSSKRSPVASTEKTTRYGFQRSPHTSCRCK